MKSQHQPEPLDIQLFVCLWLIVCLRVETGNVGFGLVRWERGEKCGEALMCMSEVAYKGERERESDFTHRLPFCSSCTRIG